jgi:hypothetical protein
MPRKCTICAHKKRSAIDKALVERRAFRAIARQHGVSKDALIRHHDDHLPTALVKAQEAKEAADADALLAQIVGLRDEGLGVLEKAKDAEDLHTVLNAIKVTQGTIELLAKLAGQLRDAPTINLVLSAEWQAVQANVLTALDPYPEARLAVAHALGEAGVAGHA